ncbi:hypothetical protein AGDE_15999 [Angomonas deanei]|uniref:Uncharacterized protein n=1 Tax=Angomonas deanei TaxID=59799 RepID=A0A7G2CHR6_9TRYP|nr:hypothetical protein AGDE_15999 [Angomonas deanei]CAD2218511.1 hypothetical protein, conserved [Angomonas deanei]|eukprot:EPY17945.1 hypothetical protein AGDE_15999 [Angomonas deanei]
MNLRHVERWTSPCLTVDDTDPDNHKIILSGSGVSFINGDLYRFRRFIISLPFPAAQVNEREEYLLFTSFQTVVEGVPSSTLTYPTRLVCDRSSYTYKRNDKSRKRCNLIRLPEEFLNNQRTDRVAVVTVTISGVPAEISNAVKTMREDDLPSVGLAYQKSAYTLATLIIRYIFLFFSLCHTVRFIVHSKHTSMLYEQRMIVTLQIFYFGT